jgi:hypothetical protein
VLVGPEAAYHKGSGRVRSETTAMRINSAMC